MQVATSIVKGHEQLTNVFGCWPSFHDSEVLSIRLEREGEDPWNSPTLYSTLHVFAGRLNENSPTGVEFYNHTLVTFRFNLVVNLELSGFNQQNAIFDLIIETPANAPTETPIAVTFQPSFGVALTFSCQSAEIVEVKQRLPGNSVYLDAGTPSSAA
jgi:Immunity protein 50